MLRLNPETDALVFQCKDIVSRDIFAVKERDEDASYDSAEKSYDKPTKDKLSGRTYRIVLFGTTSDSRSVCLEITDFKPFFYVRIPDALANNTDAIRHLEKWIRCADARVLSDEAAAEISMVCERHKTLFDYNGGHAATFLKLTVPSLALWRYLKDRFLDKRSTPNVFDTQQLFGERGKSALLTSVIPSDDSLASLATDGNTVSLKVYESNIDPMLRYFHIQNLSPASWIQVDAGNWEDPNGRDATATIQATADSADVMPAPEQATAPYTIASWDIECNSSHGDFPIAAKTWRKPVRELLEVGVPASAKALCTLIADTLAGKPTKLSPIYLKVPAEYSAEVLYNMLAGVHNVESVEANLRTLATAPKGEVRERCLTELEMLLTKSASGTIWPLIAGDEIIQIGAVVYSRGVPIRKHIWVLGTVDSDTVRPPGAEVPIHVYSFSQEVAMIRAWFQWIGRDQPDIMIGYNIFGFDSQYVWDRLVVLVGSLEAAKIVKPMSCLRSRPTRLEEKFLSSSAMGDNTMYFLSSAGRLQIDLLPYIRRNHNLDSYTLDNVSATFVSGSVSGGVKPVAEAKDTFRFQTKSTKGTVVGRYITLLDEENDRVIDRCEVVGVEPKALIVAIPDGARQMADHGVAPVRWAQVKDDVSPKDIFRLHRGSAKDRATVARYCLQDCDLVMELFNKLEILNNSVAMAHVCSVPVSYIFLRGQGIKIESLIFKECRAADQLIEVLPSSAFGEKEAEDDAVNNDVEDTYEGAIVLEPKTGIYIDDPITADDFASLYPSSIISENISHDTLISVKDYDKDGNFVCIKEGSDRYDNIPGAKYVNIEFDILRKDPGDMRKNPEKLRDGRRVARYIQEPVGTIPRILTMLLSSRKRCRKAAEAEKDEFRKSLMDAQQLAYKLTANSLYGQLGSGVFKIRRQVLAASTTAYGRKQLLFAKAVIEETYGPGKDPRCDCECIYGDTDSIFLRFQPKDPKTGVRLRGQAALQAAKDLTVESGKLVSSCLKPPHDFEFDKIFRTFCLLSKKRYVGDMSEDGLEPDDFHRKSMGIVMKRRDNAPIVKYIYGGVIDRILDPTQTTKAAGVNSAAQFVWATCRDLLAGKFPLSKLTITKSLRSEYADPTRIAHKVLAERIAERDPGNKPSTSDRIPFVYIQSTDGSKPKLQGDRIELPSYIREHNLKPDYEFYITNQIAKPVAQVFGLEVGSIPGVKVADVAATVRAKDPVAEREKLAESHLFLNVLKTVARTPEAMEARGQQSIAKMFKTAGR